MADIKPFFLLATLVLATCSIHSAESKVTLAEGLSFDFYDKSCPKLEKIIKKYLKPIFKDDMGQAAGLLRLHFHDCFVQGCDGSVLLDGSTSGPSEQSAIPNLTLRARSFQIINELKALTLSACGNVVSCSDIATIAARDAVHIADGPDYRVPLGRRDGLTFATINVTLANLPSPFWNVTTLLDLFSDKGFDVIDLVALSGGHTFGIGHCPTFAPRLYPTVDPTMDSTFASSLKLTCPTVNTDNFTVLDVKTPNRFDAKYFSNLQVHKGLFTSDQDLFTSDMTRNIVNVFADDKDFFFDMFVGAIIKMGQLGVLTGTLGEIRTNCSAINADSSLLKPVTSAVHTIADF